MGTERNVDGEEGVIIMEDREK